jgi:hypothetical protein
MRILTFVRLERRYNTRNKSTSLGTNAHTQWDNTVLILTLPDTPNLRMTGTEVSTQHKLLLQHRRPLTQQVDSTNNSTISHHKPLSVCNGDYYTTFPLPRAQTHIQPWITATTRRISTLHNTKHAQVLNNSTTRASEEW